MPLSWKQNRILLYYHSDKSLTARFHSHKWKKSDSQSFYFNYFVLFLPIFFLFYFKSSSFIVFYFIEKLFCFVRWRTIFFEELKRVIVIFYSFFFFCCLWFIGVMNTKYHYCRQFRRRNGKSKKEKSEWFVQTLLFDVYNCVRVCACSNILYKQLEIEKWRKKGKILFHLCDIYGNSSKRSDRSEMYKFW